MYQPWLTTSDWPVSAFDSKDAKKTGGVGNVLSRRKLAVHGLLEHDVLDDRLLGYAERASLFGDLLVDQRGAHEAGANNVRPDTTLCTFLGDHLGEADESVFGSDVGRLVSSDCKLRITAAATYATCAHASGPAGDRRANTRPRD